MMTDPSTRQSADRRMVVAAAQLGPVQLEESRESAVTRLVTMLRTAAARGAEFVVFPELAFTTFFPRWWNEDQDEVDARFFESSMPSPDTQPLFDTARDLGVGFYVGYAELVPADQSPDGRTRRFNTAILVAPNGEIIGKYRKIHLPGHADHKPEAAFQHLEKRYFEVGDLGFPVYRFMDALVGMLICNDRRWPEAYRVLGLQGAEMVTLGYNTPTENLHYPEPPAQRVAQHLLMAQAMAYQNAVWVVQSAKAGFENGFRMFGNSVIVAPTGEVVAKTTSEDDEVIVHDCDLSLGDDLRRTMFNLEAHRRPEHYGLIVERTGVRITPANEI